MLVTDAFETLARLEARRRGLEDLRIVVVSHPLEDRDPDGVQELAEVAAAAAIELLED